MAISNTETKDELVAKTITSTAKTALSLTKQRETWEHGALKTSNSELYQLLGDCLDFHHDLEGNPELIKELNAHLDAQNLTFNKGTRLATKIARAVFDEQKDKRAFTYARVITVAAKEKPDGVSMHDFIVERGGIEEIRRGNKSARSSAETRKKQQEDAVKYLASAKKIAPSFSVSDSNLKLDDGILFVAIMRQESSGKVSMVYETDAKSVVNSALADAGKVLGDKATSKPVAGNINSSKTTLSLTDAVVIENLTKQFAA